MGNVAAVFLFEWKRALTLPRMMWWGVLAAFPVFIVGVIRFTTYQIPPREFWAGMLYALIPMLVSMLGMLLWATPAISAELERRSWVYLTVRPNGGTAVLLGKYLAAVTWVIPPAADWTIDRSSVGRHQRRLASVVDDGPTGLPLVPSLRSRLSAAGDAVAPPCLGVGGRLR